jgi:hypothetical protein
MGIKNSITLLVFGSVFIFGAGRALAAGIDGPVQGGEQGTDARESCLTTHYPNFKGDRAVWGYMPGSAEQEAICRIEFDMVDSRQAKEEIAGNEKSPVTLELRKLWIMERLYSRYGVGTGVATVFSGDLVKNPPGKYLGIKPGVKPEQAPRMDTSGVRERVPDLLRTLDFSKAPKIYYFHRIDERLPAVCVEPKADGSCTEIVSKKKNEQQNKKTTNGEEEGKFKKFMKKVKSSFSGPPPKEISEWKKVDFHGVPLSEVAYSFDYDFAYIGFFARIADREPFNVRESPQYIRDVFRTLIREFGEPALKIREKTASQAIWVTGDGFRIDAICDTPPNNNGLCRDGRIAVRRLPPVEHPNSSEGAGFFE